MLVVQSRKQIKISDIEEKNFTASDYSKFTCEMMKQKGLIDKSNILNRVKSSDLNKKLATLATKPELKVKQDN